jgi:hypothetical protein
MFGRIFSAWVNQDNCDSWAWTDLDILLGNLREFLEGNSLVEEMDVFTLAGKNYIMLINYKLGIGRIYTRGGNSLSIAFEIHS